MDLRLKENLSFKQQNYIAPFLWLHGEKKELISKELKHIYDCGIRSVCLESRTHEEFCREGWWNDVRYIFEECRKLDMQVWILDDKHFPSGYANGIFETDEYKDMRAFGITEKHIDICGPADNCSAMAKCWLENDEDEIVAIVALRHIENSKLYDNAIDITDGLENDMVYFSLPEGTWRIVFLIKTRSGIGDCWINFCDKLNPSATDAFIKEVYEPHFAHFKEYFGNTFLGFFSDEPGFANNSKNKFMTPIGIPYSHYPWRENVRTKLCEKYSDKTNTILPALWFDFESSDQANIREYYMDIITEEYKNNFCNKLADWCHIHGIKYIGHIIEDNNAHYMTGASAGHYYRALDGQDMSGIDVVLHQIVPGLTECSNAGYVCYKHMNNNFFHYYLGKLASSMAHIDPKKQGRAMCEIFGAYGWAEGTKIMKYLADHMLVRGINYFVPHAFSPKLNDPDCPPNFYDSGRNPQYKFFGHIINYMNRMCHMLSDAIHIPTCALLYDAESNWRTTENLPLEDVAKVLYDNQLDYDIIPIDYLDKFDKNGCINGEKYPLLIIPSSKCLSPKISSLAENISIPVITVSAEEEKHENYTNVLLDNLADFMKPYRDISSDYNGIYLRYCHFKRNNTHVYMFTNEDINNQITTKIKLSAFKGGEYAEYDAMNNKAYRCYSDDSEIEISIPTYSSTVVLFGDIDCSDLTQKPNISISDKTELNLQYDISIKKESDKEYTFYKRTNKLFNICGKDELPDFSGDIKYDTQIELTAGKHYILDLGEVGEAVRLYINNQYVEFKLSPPYSFDISDFIVDGKNKITVIVSTTNAYERKDDFSKYLKFEPCGLLGNVNLYEYKI